MVQKVKTVPLGRPGYGSEVESRLDELKVGEAFEEAGLHWANWRGIRDYGSLGVFKRQTRKLEDGFHTYITRIK